MFTAYRVSYSLTEQLTQRAGLKTHYFYKHWEQGTSVRYSNLLMLQVAWLTVPDQTSLDEGNFLGEDSKEWPTRKKEKTNKHYKPTCSSKV